MQVHLVVVVVHALGDAKQCGSAQTCVATPTGQVLV